ncbi:Pr6Pr family membrane protein [Bifidobacterium catulorum]|uniref:Pr6Pr family membrane protein n=1 Tax=Bifidobacterium catulorum TaxID=1630173 RepID=A0A2U2MSZ2_9BIFI|nr:Pr6Pr family membrane protein [Bifidobacterium catulorum]PWG59968.1 hypothetical protein DF200_04825 [Bifidobacterium catulorum]
MRFLAAIFRFATSACCFAGTLEIWHLHDFASLTYFTFQTALLLGVVMLWSGAATLLKGIEPPAWLKGCLTLYIVAAGLAAVFILPAADPSTPRVFGLMTVTYAHVIVPIAAFVDFVVFDEHRRFQWTYCLTWLIYIPIYVMGVLIRAAIWPHSGPLKDGTPYPYGFLDLPKIGWTQLGINVGEGLAAFLVLGLVLVALDRVLPPKLIK